MATLGRIALVVELAEKIEPHEHAKVVTRLYRRGDNAERVAVLRALPALPQPAQLLPLAVDACRSHVQDVFEAIACENSYPAEFFADANFYQLVLKAFFTEVETSRIVNLASRRSAELTRMAEGYASERRAAGRSVPADLPHVLGDSMSPALTSTHQDS